jgi:hypothetical protein
MTLRGLPSLITKISRASQESGAKESSLTAKREDDDEILLKT